MLKYLALLGLPEWTALSRIQRRFVWQHCVHPFLAKWQIRLVELCVTPLGMFAALRFGAFDHMRSTLVALFIVIFLLPDLFDTCWVARHRREVSSFIQSHGADIQTAA